MLGTLSINNSGQITGISQTASSTYDVFLWTPEDGMQDIGTLGYNCATAYINQNGQVAGTCDAIELFPPNPEWGDPGLYIPHPYLWT